MENKQPYNTPDLSIRQIATFNPIAASLASGNDNEFEFTDLLA